MLSLMKFMQLFKYYMNYSFNIINIHYVYLSVFWIFFSNFALQLNVNNKKYRDNPSTNKHKL